MPRRFPVVLGKELRHAFVTPIAYAATAVFWAASGYLFTFNIVFVNAAQMVTAFHNMSLLLMLTMPFLTMRSVAEERASGTLEHLLTLPLEVYTIVLAKYAALLVLLALLLAGTTTAAGLLVWFGQPDLGPILGGYAGVFLLGAAFAAIGLFVSALCANQATAAAVTWGALIALWFIDYAGTLDLDYRVVLAARHLSLSLHYLDLIRGVLTLPALAWLAALIALPLALAVAALRFGRLEAGWRAKFHALALPVLAVAVAAAAVNAWALRSGWRLDLTSAGVFTIGEQTRAVLATLKQPVAATFFYDSRSKAMTDARALLEQYGHASPLVQVRAIDPMRAPSVARQYQVNFAGTVVFESGGRRITVNGGSENEFTNGLLRAARSAGQRLCFTDGHLESDPLSIKTHDHFEGDMGHRHSHASGGRRLEIHERHGMGMAKDALALLGYTVDKVVLAAGGQPLAGCALAIVASPRRPFLAREVALLQQYLEGGGRALVMLEPEAGDANLAPVLAAYGVTVERAFVRDPRQYYWTDPQTPAVTAYARHRITRNLGLSFFPGAAPLFPAAGGPPADVRVVPLVETSRDSRLEPAPPDTRKRGPRSLTLMVEATRSMPGAPGQPHSRLVVAGDGDFATNSFFPILGNGQLFLNVVSSLAGELDLIGIAPRHYEQPRLALTNRQVNAVFVLSTVLAPLALLAFGALLWQRRARGGGRPRDGA